MNIADLLQVTFLAPLGVFGLTALYLEHKQYQLGEGGLSNGYA